MADSAIDTGTEYPDVLALLEAQHQEIRGLLDQVAAASGSERQALFDQLREYLARHETGEEMMLRPLTRSVEGGEQVSQARFEEENESKKVLAELEKLDVTSTEFEQMFAEFASAVREHAAAEERDEFPLLRAEAQESALVHAESQLRKAEKMTPTHPHPTAKTTTANYVAGPFAAMLDRARDAFSRSDS